jgi:hypothetical protein
VDSLPVLGKIHQLGYGEELGICLTPKGFSKASNSSSSKSMSSSLGLKDSKSSAWEDLLWGEEAEKIDGVFFTQRFFLEG